MGLTKKTIQKVGTLYYLGADNLHRFTIFFFFYWGSATTFESQLTNWQKTIFFEKCPRCLECVLAS